MYSYPDVAVIAHQFKVCDPVRRFPISSTDVVLRFRVEDIRSLDRSISSARALDDQLQAQFMSLGLNSPVSRILPTRSYQPTSRNEEREVRFPNPNTDWSLSPLANKNFKTPKQAVGGNQQAGHNRTTQNPSTPTTGLASSNPRKRKLTTCEDKETSEPNDSTGGSVEGPTLSQKSRLYACPYYRNDPNNPIYFTGGKYEKCRRQGIKTDRLKYV